ncbi:MAG: hypothetical protein LRY52_12995 [Sulfurospirillum cavolei]|nr:hypothetical protein [Sulfurospirillum cavolei]
MIVQNIIDASGQMNDNYAFIEKIVHHSALAQSHIGEAEGVIKKASLVSSQASEVSQKLSSDTTMILENVTYMYEVSLKNSTDVHELNGASKNLLAQAGELSHKLNQFQI